jgi:hypothetical protein
MAFIGNTNTTQAFTPAVDFFSGNASTTAFTLSRPVASVAQVEVYVSNVPQTPGTAYTVSSNTITFTSAPPSGTNNIYVYYTSPITQVIAPGQGTVTSSSFGTITDFTTTGNTTLGDATTDTLTVGVTGIVKDSSGNVGIGTASPTVKLDINGSSRTVGSFAPGSSGWTSAGFIGTGSYGGGVALIDGSAGYGLYAQDSGATFIIGQGATSGGLTERLRITSTGLFQFNSGYGSAATAYGCRAWVNFNGTGTVAIRSSGNVSSITDGGVGIYRVNFSTSMPDVNFSTNASVAGGGTVNSSTCAFLVNATSAAAGGQTSNVAYVDVWCYHPGNQVAQDNAWCSVSVFR